jgi:SAM-dependent methyltransferase
MMRWRRGAERGGRLPSLGQDYGEAHRLYVERLGAGGELWLRTKPFSSPPGHELRECLRTFAHLVERLDLGVRAQVLDVGCGPGWLSEFLTRCGYWVTGVDVSADMVAIARERIASITEPIGEGVNAVAEFHALPVLEMPWNGRFDAAVLYDAMHHFDDELETLSVIRRTLAPGGRIFIHEGVRPAEGSEGEQELIAEMEAYGTLESPFDPEYLEDVVSRAGFEQVTRFTAVDELLDLADAQRELERVRTRMAHPPMNTVIATNPVPRDLSDAPLFHGEIDATGARQDGDGYTVHVAIRNSGRAYWPNGLVDSIPTGTVTVGSRRAGELGTDGELVRALLPRSLASGESAEVQLRFPRHDLQPSEAVELNLVREGIAWFDAYGTEPALVRVPDED